MQEETGRTREKGVSRNTGGSKMIRELMTQGVVKEYHRSLSSDSRLRERERDRLIDRSAEHLGTPRHLTISSRSSSKADNWIYILIALLFVSVTGSLLLHFHSFGAPQLQSSVDCGDKLSANTIAVQVAYLAGKVINLQEKVGKASKKIQDVANKGPPSTPSNALGQLTLERTRSSSLLVEIALGLDGMANLLMELKESGVDITKTAAGREAYDKFSKNARNNVKQMLTADYAEGVGLKAPSREELESAESSRSDPLYNFFEREEIRKYIKVRENRGGRKNFMGVNVTYGAIGHACVSNKNLLEKYMDYDVGEYCRDDWIVAQQLIIRGCEPLPRRRCRARGPKLYTKPLPAGESLWAVPANENVRWDNYFCQNFTCLAEHKGRKKFFKCSPCFDFLQHEKLRWVVPNTTDGEFLIADVLALKPGEMRLGLDYSIGTGTFAARMKEHNVTIASTTLNLGAPFSETIALRGLLPLYISINQRLPFFDNTLDIVHTTLFLDGWIDHQLLDFILFDFDRILRPGGLLWLDRFFCLKDDLAEYLFYFKRLRYKVHMWVTIPKTNKGENEIYFSAVWEKPASPF